MNRFAGQFTALLLAIAVEGALAQSTADPQTKSEERQGEEQLPEEFRDMGSAERAAAQASNVRVQRVESLGGIATARTMPAEGRGPDMADDASAGLIFAETLDDRDAASSSELRRRVFDDAKQELDRLPPGSDRYLDIARQLLAAGYYLGWSLLDNRDLEQGNRVIATMEAVLRPYDDARVPPELRLGFARLLWLQQRRNDEYSAQPQPRDVRPRVLRLTESVDIYPRDTVDLLSLRFAALWYTPTDEPHGPGRAQACAIAERINQLSPNYVNTNRLIECALQAARDAQAAADFGRSETMIGQARQLSRDAIRNRPDSVLLALTLVNAELASANLAIAQERRPDQARFELAAMRAFVAALRGRAHFQRNPAHIGYLYAGFRDIDFSALEIGDVPQRRAAAIQFFEQVVEGVAESRRVYPRAGSYGLVAGDALSRIANLHREGGNLGAALTASGEAIAIFAQVRPAEPAVEFDEKGSGECAAYSNRIRVLVDMGRPTEALTAYRELDRLCRPWFRRFPWDFYSRTYLTASAMRVGGLLHRERRYVEARPILEFASNWGAQESSTLLAEIYRDGLDTPADPARAQQLTALAQRQPMKRFTVPTNFGATRSPFNVYVLEYARGEYCPIQRAPLPEDMTCIGFEGVDDQAEWVNRARGGDMPRDVIDAFRRLNRIARENNVSLPELAVYALGAAQQEQRPAAAGQAGNPPQAAASAPASTQPAGGGQQAPPSASAPASASAPSEGSGPDSLSPSLLNQTSVILLQGRNNAGQPIYTYLQLTLGRLRDLRDAMRRNEDFEPGNYGTVLAQGVGAPSEEVRARMAREHNMVDVPPAPVPPPSD